MACALALSGGGVTIADIRAVQRLFRFARGASYVVLLVLFLAVLYAAWMGIRNWGTMNVV